MTASSSRAWVKPAVIGAAVLAIAGIGFATFSQQQQAPDVTFIAINGQKISTQDLRGKVVMINFWATSCATCVKEMPQMVETYNKFKQDGLEFVAVAMSYDPPNYVLNYAETRKLPFQVAIDNTGKVAKDWGEVQLTPTSYVVNKKGEIVKRYVGEPDFAELHRLIEKLLAET